MPLWRRLREILLGSPRLFVDETRAPVLDPGRGRTKSGYFWSIARDDSAWCGDTGPPGVVYTYAPGRGAEHAATLLAGYRGIVQCDGYAAYKQLARRGRAGNAVILAFCWSHWRRRFYEIAKAGSAPIAEEALRRIAELYKIEAQIRGRSAAERQSVRQAQSKPLVADLKAWLQTQLARASAKSAIAVAIRYGLNHWEGLERFLEDGRIEIDTNVVERSMRPIATRRPLCPPSLSIWEHWKRVGISGATRATFSGHCHFDRFRRQIIGADLVRRSSNNLLGGKDAGFNEAA